jgi:integrase
MKLDAKAIARLALPAGKADVIYFDDNMPGFGLRLRDSGDGVRKSWIVQYRRAGGSRRMLLGSAAVLSIEQARKRAKDILAKVQLGEDPQRDKVERRARERFSMRALASDYLQAKKPGVRARTFIESERYLTGPYFKPLHNMPIEQITRRDVAARVLAISRESGATTAGRARSALSSMFAWSMQMGLCESNPVAGTPEVKTPPSRDRVLTDAELGAIWKACGDDDFGRIVRLLLLTGQRRTEVGGVTWGELDLDGGTWTIPAQRTKNGRQHTLPLSALAVSVIEAIPQRVGRDCLFGERGTSGFCSWATAKAALDARLGGQVAKWTLHDIRRSVATRMCDLGVMPHVVEQILNHQSGHRGGIVGVYNRSAYEGPVKAALGMWADHIRTLVEGGERKVLAYRPAAVTATP